MVFSGWTPKQSLQGKKNLIPLEVKKIHQQTKEKNVNLIPNAITHPKFSLKLIGLIMGNCTLLRRFIQDHHWCGLLTVFFQTQACWACTLLYPSWLLSNWKMPWYTCLTIMGSDESLTLLGHLPHPFGKAVVLLGLSGRSHWVTEKSNIASRDDSSWHLGCSKVHDLCYKLKWLLKYNTITLNTQRLSRVPGQSNDQHSMALPTQQE
jgi:hypothetical protein